MEGVISPFKDTIVGWLKLFQAGPAEVVPKTNSMGLKGIPYSELVPGTISQSLYEGRGGTAPCENYVN